MDSALHAKHYVTWDVSHESDLGYHRYFAPRAFAALARPLPRVPRRPPRAAPPLPAGAAPPRPAPVIRDAGAGVANLGADFEDAGGFSTKDVSVVLRVLAVVRHERYQIGSQECCFSVNFAVKSI